MSDTRVPASGRPAETPEGPTPTERRLPDGQHADHWILSAEERAKGFVRPVRRSYVHVGIRPRYPLRELTAEEKERYGPEGYVGFEPYPESELPVTGRFWTERDMKSGCGAVTTMGLAIAETYARDPGFYGSTFCAVCHRYFRVGEHGEFVWDDGSGQRVGT